MTNKVFGQPMPWLDYWSRPEDKRRSAYQGIVGEDFLARAARVALAPAPNGAALLGVSVSDELGDCDMLVHIGHGEGDVYDRRDHLMLIDSKNWATPRLTERDVERAQQRISEFISTGTLGVRANGTNGFKGITVSYHFVFTGAPTLSNWQTDARDGSVLLAHHPGATLDGPSHPIVASSYETVIGDLVVRAMRDVPKEQMPTTITKLLDTVVEQRGNTDVTPFTSIMERDHSYQWHCTYPESDSYHCFAHSQKNPHADNFGYLKSILHSENHRIWDSKGRPEWEPNASHPTGLAQRVECDAATGLPTWETLIGLDKRYGWEPGTAAGILISGPDRDESEIPHSYVAAGTR